MISMMFWPGYRPSFSIRSNFSLHVIFRLSVNAISTLSRHELGVAKGARGAEITLNVLIPSGRTSKPWLVQSSDLGA